MDSHRSKIEKLTPVQLANELANNGYVNYHKMILDRNIDGKEFLSFDENKVQELKLIMNNVQVQLLWSFIQRIQKYPEEFMITNKVPILPATMTKPFNSKNEYNRLSSESNLKADEERRRELLPQKPVINKEKPVINKVKPVLKNVSKKSTINSTKEIFEKQNPAASPKQHPSSFVKQNPLPTKPFQQSSSRTTENITGNLTVSEELEQLKRSGSIRKHLESFKRQSESGTFPIFPNVKLPEIRPFTNSAKQSNNKNFTPTYPNHKPKPFTNVQRNIRQTSSTLIQRTRSPIKQNNGLSEIDNGAHPVKEISINEVSKQVEKKIHGSSNKIPNIDNYLDTRKLEIQHEISNLGNGIGFKKKRQSLQEHFQGLRRVEEAENHYRNMTADPTNHHIDNDRIWDADNTFEHNSDKWDSDSENWDNSKDNSDRDESYTQKEEKRSEEQPQNDFPPPIGDSKPSTSLLLPTKMLSNFQIPSDKGLVRPPVPLPDTSDDLKVIDDDKNQQLYTEEPDLDELTSLYEPGPVLDQSSELEELIGGPSLPYRRFSSLLNSPQERDLPEIPVDICNISRKEAESLLMQTSVGTFIFRKSKEYFGALTIKGEARCFHIPMRKDVRGMYFDTVNEKKFFKDLNELVRFYKSNDFMVGNSNIRLITLYT